MTTDQTSKKLLAKSFLVSVQRISKALSLSLCIQNSGPPPDQPIVPGEVVGLCGQGGGHPYFRIPKHVLEATLDRILQSFDCSIESQMDVIALACQSLRQQTFFYDNTGCINDQVPSLVPLLPPSEIWLDGQQLPMDVWRLVSFEFDLVSSAISSQLLMDDFAFGSVNQSALSFCYFIQQLGNHQVKFEVELNQLPAPWSVTNGAPKTLEVSLARIFIEAGILLTPLATQAYVKWYGAIRYLHWIDSSSAEFKVKNEFNQDTIDCRYRGLFAEEAAIGLMAIILGEIFNTTVITNTVEVVHRPQGAQGQPIADFVAQTTNPATKKKTTIIAESKGSLGALVSKSRHNRAKQQLAATKILIQDSSDLLPLTFGSVIRFSKQRLNSRCIVTDPPSHSETNQILIDPIEIFRVAYAKALKFFGLEIASEQILRGEAAKALQPIDFFDTGNRPRSNRDIQRRERATTARNRFEVSLLLDVGSHAVSIHSPVLEVLQQGINEGTLKLLNQILDSRKAVVAERFRGSSFEIPLGIGCIAFAELDETRPNR